MGRHGGSLVYSGRDEQGPLEVVDAHGVRALHFGTAPRQSAMALSEPERLELSYQRAMLAGLLFAPEPGRALLLGLGGGSLAKFMRHQFPDCLVEAVEYRPSVVKIAQSFFGLPEEPRLTIHIADAAEFVCRQAESRAAFYDFILIDIYDGQGMAHAAGRHDFFAAGAKLLRPQGVCAINLWGSRPDSLRHVMRLLGLYFDGRVLRLEVIGRGNVIGFGLGAEVPKPDRKAAAARARALENRLGIEFPRLLQQMSPLR